MEPTLDNHLARTPLYDLHVSLQARMTAFAGYSMPLQYQNGIRAEHQHTRSNAGLFDVSHMGQITLVGSLEKIESLIPYDYAGSTVGRQCYCVLPNDQGGIIDDLIITRWQDRLSLVVNAESKSKVFDYMTRQLGDSCKLSIATDRALIAVQGPAARSILQDLDLAIDDLQFMHAKQLDWEGDVCTVSCCGYTGEDGFEISVLADQALDLAKTLLSDPRVNPVGLGARDSLRLEAGLCLSGSDIGPEITLAQARLNWLIPPKYRGDNPASKAMFPGASTILDGLKSKPEKYRVGLKPLGRNPLRAHTPLLNDDSQRVGEVTSGSFGASVGHPIAMAYVESKFANPGTVLKVNVRGKEHAVEICALPFVANRYHRN